MTEQRFHSRFFRVVANTPLALETFSLTLASEDNEPVFEFQAGQWVGVKLPHVPISHKRTFAFSLASAPVESAHAIELAIKVYGSFSRTLQTLQIGDRVSIQGPFGVFVLKPGGSRAVFCAGGIGISPLRSMIRQMLLSQDPRESILLYSNRIPLRAAYESEFRELARTHKNFHPVFLITGEAEERGDVELGRINRSILDRVVPEIANTEWYMCGPRPFMDHISEILKTRGVDVQRRLHRELFA